MERTSTLGHAVPNLYEREARARKADRLATTCRRHGLTAAGAGHLEDQGRRTFERAANVHHASDATWALVADRLATIEDADSDAELLAAFFAGTGR